MKKMKLDDIKISPIFAKTSPKEHKMDECRKIWNDYHLQDRYIVVNRNNVLIDGYVQYLILKENGVENAQVVVSDRRREKWYRKNTVGMDNLRYRTTPTTYIYGTHLNSEDTKQYIWRVPESWGNWSEKVQIGDTILCATKFGCSPVVVDKVEILDKCPVQFKVKRVCKKEIRRDGYVVE